MAETYRRAGALRERVNLQVRADGQAWGSNRPGTGAFGTQFTVSAGLRPLRGTEAVQAARLGGRQPYVLTVRNSSQTRQVTTSWRVVDARNETRIFAITSPLADPDGKNAWLECIVVEGAGP